MTYFHGDAERPERMTKLIEVNVDAQQQCPETPRKSD